MIRRLVALMLAGVVLSASSSAAPAAYPPRAQVIGPGTVLVRIRQSGPGGPIEVFILRVSLTDPRVRAGLLYPGAVAAARTVSAMAGEAGAFAGVNGDFFNIGASDAPVGPVVAGGRLLKAPQPGRGLAAGVGVDGVGRVATVTLRGYVVLPGVGARAAGRGVGAQGVGIRGVRVPLADLNDANPGYRPMLSPNGIGLFTPAWGTYSRGGAVRGLPAVTEALIRDGRLARLLHHAGAGPIPAGDYVLLGAGAGAHALNRLRIGQPVSVHVAQSADAGVPFDFAIGGKYRLLRGGAVPNGLPPFPGAARTAVGFAAGGRTMYLLASQAAAPGARGWDLSQLARFMRGLGAIDAVDLDDGGSTTMVARLPGRGGLTVVNRPADGTERRVANGIGLFAH